MAAPDTDRLQRQRALFEQALEIEDAAERADFLAQECGDDRELWKELQALLAAEDESPTEFMAPQEIPVEATPPGEAPGDRIGPYTLIDQLGDGAFGVVWRAEQSEPVQREVALKIIKPGMDSSEVVARFEAERQALALMDHPSIAQVYDAGTTDLGRPYFVMELVRGVPITDYCDDKKLSIQARLRLFIEVCRAVQHAHQKGVIHRDLKPSNILVVDNDGKSLPKVIDFGIAKAIDQELASRTLATLEGQFIGTPQYMSPEQTGVSGSDIDTRADVYALGAVLYELLTGSTPLTLEQLKAGGWGEMERLIREEEPPKPSVRTTTINASRSRHLRGDLDWVVMKALEKDRDRRYETANEVARELEHFLANEPVSAGPPTLGYRTKKFLRRNRTLAVSLATIALVLVAAAIVSSVLAVRAREAEGEALQAEQAEAAKGRSLARQLSTSLVTHARHRAAEGDPSEALLWHIEASSIAAKAGIEQDGGAEDGRFRIAGAFANVPPIEWLGFENSELQRIVVDPHQEWIAVKGNQPDRLIIRDNRTGKKTLRTDIPRARHMLSDRSGRFLVLALHNGALVFNTAAFGAPPIRLPFEPGHPRIDINHDGTLLALFGKGGNLTVFDLERNEILHETTVPWPLEPEFPANESPANCCRFSNTSDLLVVATTSGKSSYICGLDARTGGVQVPPRRFRGRVADDGLEFHPSDHYLAAFCHTGIRIRIWEISTGAELEPPKVPAAKYPTLADDQLIVPSNERVRFYSFPPPCELLDEVVLPPMFGKDRTIMLSPDRSTFLIGPRHGGDRLLWMDRATGNSTLLSPGSGRMSAARAIISPAGNRISTADSAGVIRVSSSWVQRPPDLLLAEADPDSDRGLKAQYARYTVDGSAIAGVFDESGAAMWDSGTGTLLHDFSSSSVSDSVEAIELSNDGALLALGHRKAGRISIRSVAAPTEPIRELDYGGHFLRMIISPKGRYVAAAGSGYFRIWEIETGELVTERRCQGVYSTATLIFSPDEAWLLGQYYPGDPDRTTHQRILHHIADGTDRVIDVTGREGRSLRFTSDGRFLVGGQHVYRCQPNGETELLHQLTKGVTYGESYCALAHDGKRVALVQLDGSVEIWSIEEGILAAPKIPSDARAVIASFSSDDRWLATGSAQGEVTVWDVDSGALISGPLKAGDLEVLRLQFHPGGRPQFLASTKSGRLTVWNLTNPLVERASLNDLRTAAEILANRRITEAGTMITLSKEELHQRWRNWNDTVRALVTRKAETPQPSKVNSEE